MKVLYYPSITRDDYDRLISKFSEEYSTLETSSRLSYMTAMGATMLSWGLAYGYRFKFNSFLALTLGSFVATKCAISSFYSYRMKDNCNAFAKDVAKAYPEIKYLRINYTESDKLNKI
jgi:hypothetical protein